MGVAAPHGVAEDGCGRSAWCGRGWVWQVHMVWQTMGVVDPHGAAEDGCGRSV
jgi:hypothetical protein